MIGGRIWTSGHLVPGPCGCSIASPCHENLRHLYDAFPHTTWRTNNVSQAQLHRYISPTRDGIPRRFRHGPGPRPPEKCPNPLCLCKFFTGLVFCIILGDSCIILGDIYRGRQEERRPVHGACAAYSMSLCEHQQRETTMVKEQPWLSWIHG